jgi:hypothetical protein
MILHVGHSRTPIKRTESPTLCFGRHHVLRRNQPRWRMAPADTQIVAEGGMSSIRCGHHPAEPVALDFACRVAGWAGNTIAFVCDILPVKLNRGRRGMHCRVRCRLVAIQYEIAFHGWSMFDEYPIGIAFSSTYMPPIHTLCWYQDRSSRPTSSHHPIASKTYPHRCCIGCSPVGHRCR